MKPEVVGESDSLFDEVEAMTAADTGLLKMPASVSEFIRFIATVMGRLLSGVDVFAAISQDGNGRSVTEDGR